MVNDKIIDLIHRDLDGTISDSDREALQKHLKADEEARRMHADLAQMHRTLADMPRVEPPPAIRDHVLRQIGPRWKSVRQASPRRGLSEVFGSIIERFRVQPAIPFAVGIVAGALLLIPIAGQIGDGNGITGSQVAGTIIWDGPEPELESVGTREFNTGAVRGTLSTSRTDGAVVAELVVIASGDPVNIEFTYDPWDVAFQGIASLRKPASYVSADGDLVRLTHSGENLYRLAFADYPDKIATINVKISSDRVLWEGSIRTGF